MKVIVFASQKGGVGKTTLAAHLAVTAEAAGEGPVVLIDTDPQASLSDWWNARTAETPRFIAADLSTLSEQIAALREAGATLLMIDTPPAMTAAIQAVIAQADLVVIPVKPSPHDLRAVGGTVALAEAEKKPFLFALTQAKATAKLTAQAVAALSAHGPVAPAFIIDRVDYAASMIDGRTVGELSSKSAATQEISDLWQQVKTRLEKGER